MSGIGKIFKGIGKAVGKVFKAVGSVVGSIFKNPLLGAALVGGLAFAAAPGIAATGGAAAESAAAASGAAGSVAGANAFGSAGMMASGAAGGIAPAVAAPVAEAAAGNFGAVNTSIGENIGGMQAANTAASGTADVAGATAANNMGEVGMANTFASNAAGPSLANAPTPGAFNVASSMTTNGTVGGGMYASGPMAGEPTMAAAEQSGGMLGNTIDAIKQKWNSLSDLEKKFYSNSLQKFMESQNQQQMLKQQQAINEKNWRLQNAQSRSFKV